MHDASHMRGTLIDTRKIQVLVKCTDHMHNSRQMIDSPCNLLINMMLQPQKAAASSRCTNFKQTPQNQHR